MVRRSQVMVVVFTAIAGLLILGPVVALPATAVGGSANNSFLTLPNPDEFSAAQGGAPGASSFTPLCLPSSDTGGKLQAVYVYDATQVVSDKKLAQIRQAMDEADRIVFLSADKQGGGRRLRLVTERVGSSCQVSVVLIPVDASIIKSSAPQDLIDPELIAKGVISDNSVPGAASTGIVPVLFLGTDPGSYTQCGLGNTVTDDAVDGANSLPQSGVATIWASCWNGFTVVHEVMHVLGAVQDSAPHSTKNGHCFDGVDPLCYADGGENQSQLFICPSTPYRPSGLLDCNGDDYFAVNPAPGSYLATHFNIANNSPYIQSVTPSQVGWPTVSVLASSASALPFTGVPFTAQVSAPGGFLLAGSGNTYGNDHCGVVLSSSAGTPGMTHSFLVSGVAYCRSASSEVRNVNNILVAGPFPSVGAYFSVVDAMGRDTAGLVKFNVIKTSGVYPVKDSYSIRKPSGATGGRYLVTLSENGKLPGSKSFNTPLVGLSYQVLDQSSMQVLDPDGKSSAEVISDGNGVMHFSFPANLKGHLIDLENDSLDGNVNWNLRITQFRLP